MELSAEHILQLRDSHTANAESHAFEALEAQLFVPKESTQAPGIPGEMYGMLEVHFSVTFFWRFVIIAGVDLKDACLVQT